MRSALIGAAVAAALVGGGAVVYWKVRTPATAAPARTHLGYVRDGGGSAPPADPKLADALGTACTNLSLAIERGQGAVARSYLDALARWPAVAPAWHDLATLATAPDATPDLVRHSAAAVSDALARAKLGYVVDAQVFGSGRRHVALHAYRVDEVLRAAGDAPAEVRVLHRIDGLGRAPSLFGMQSEDVAAVVLVDQIADHVLRRYLDVLAPNAPFRIDGQGWWAKRGAKVAAAAGAALRDELAAALGPDGAAGKQLGSLVAGRRDALGDWPAHYLHWAHSNRLIDSVLLPDDYLAELGRTEKPDTAALVAQQEAELAALGADRIAGAIVDRFVDAVARHEAQHALDAVRATPLPLPAVVEEVIAADAEPAPDAADPAAPAAPATGGPDTGEASPPPEVRGPAARTHLELSAYLAQLASEPAIPHLVFWALARNAFDGRASGRAELYVAAIVIEGVARQLGIDTARAADRDRLDRQYLGQLAIALSQRSGADLRRGAAGLWQELYGEPFRPVVLHR